MREQMKNTIIFIIIIIIFPLTPHSSATTHTLFKCEVSLWERNMSRNKKEWKSIFYFTKKKKTERKIGKLLGEMIEEFL